MKNRQTLITSRTFGLALARFLELSVLLMVFARWSHGRPISSFRYNYRNIQPARSANYLFFWHMRYHTMSCCRFVVYFIKDVLFVLDNTHSRQAMHHKEIYVHVKHMYNTYTILNTRRLITYILDFNFLFSSCAYVNMRIIYIGLSALKTHLFVV